MTLSEMENKYFEYVQQQAAKLGKVFMLDTGEGNDLILPERNWYIEEYTGWLIDFDQREKFLEAEREDQLEETFPNDYVWVKWKLTEKNQIEVRFEKIPAYY